MSGWVRDTWQEAEIDMSHDVEVRDQQRKKMYHIPDTEYKR